PDGAAGDGPGGFAAEPDSPGGTTGIVDAFDDIYTQVDEGSIYQLVPSAKEEATMAAPIEEKKRQQRTAIRDFDLMNYYAPGIVHHPHGVGECVEYVEGQKITGHSGKTKVMVKQPIPSDDDPCWIRLHNGVGQYQFMHDFPDGNDECAPKDSATLYEDSIIYGDFDGDGYEDAAGLIQEQGCFDGGPLASIWIYNPDDPQHPDFFYQPSGSWPTLERLTIEGSDVVGHSPEGCIYFIITVTREDGELKVISNDDPNFEECLGVPTSR
ncbi:MAG: hypothetical protein Q4P66_07865, partial [Actinomycetaceae bacterium]|nr:hypothetical protein [Actinomycetaceae bacterium]